MNPTEYQDTQDRILLAAVALAGLPYDRFLVAAEKVGLVGPITGPALYRGGPPALAAIRELAQRAAEFEAAFWFHRSSLIGAIEAATARANRAQTTPPEVTP